MTEEQLQTFKASLLERKNALTHVAQTSDDAAATVELDQSRQGRLSRMDALQGQAMSIATKHRRHMEIASIEKALRRIDDGSYGYCQRCDNEIALKRLEFDMTVLYCINCANQLES